MNNPVNGHSPIESIFGAIANWVTKYRQAAGLRRELAKCGPEEVAAIARDIGLSTDELESRRKLGRFITSRQLTGDFHVRNPQLLPNIIGQGHLLQPDEWRAGEDQTFETLEKLGKLLD